MIVFPLLVRAFRALGLNVRSAAQRDMRRQLTALTERQLDDIGLTHGLIDVLVLHGPEAVKQVIPDGAVQRMRSAT